MSNMSYCRFQNTMEDLRDCRNHIHDTNLSVEEDTARAYVIELCKEILDKIEDKDN